MESTHDTTPAEDQGADDDFPSLPTRLMQVFLSPGALTEKLAERPKWLGALLVSAVIIGISMALIPTDVFMEAQRQAALERGTEIPEMPESMAQAMRFIIPTTTVLFTFIMSFFFAGLYTLVFAFVLGDEGRYKQYLAVLTHAWFIAALFGLALTPLRISTGNPQFTLNLASFLVFLPEGYLLNVFTALDISQIWSTLVFAQGAHAIDPRRSFGSAVAIGMVVLVGFAMIAAIFL